MSMKAALAGLFAGAGLLHLAMVVAAGVVWDLEARQAKPAAYLYSFYRPRLAGERIDSSAYNETRGGKSFSDDLRQAYGKVCILGGNSSLLMLTAPGDADMASLRGYTQTWVPARSALLGVEEGNGYVVLIAIFLVSFAFQAYFAWNAWYDDETEAFFCEPCMERWLEYALTSPLQIVLIASLLMIRDMYTLTLLLVAQAACVLLGFGVECALYTASEYEPIDVGRRRRDQAGRLWWVCFLSSAVLHICIWYLLIFQHSSIEQETSCYADPPKGPPKSEWMTPLRGVVYTQFVLFTLFAAVPVMQKVYSGRGRSIKDNFLHASLAYAILSVAAKFALGVSYICFVRLFPFASKG